MTKFIKLLGLSLSVIFSIGAIVGAMITMFAAVASRIGEIGSRTTANVGGFVLSVKRITVKRIVALEHKG